MTRWTEQGHDPHEEKPTGDGSDTGPNGPSEVERRGPTLAAVILPWERPRERDINGSTSGTNGAEPARAAASRLEEAVGLAAAIGLVVVHQVILPMRGRRPATLLGGGQVQTLGQAIEDLQVEVAIVDATLSPVQQRNLERAWHCKVIDRTALILDIFGERAATKEGTLQVELAHLAYQRSRLVRSWTHLERQRGGFGFLGGPGETQIEADRRLIDERLVRLRKDLQQVRRTRGLHRGARKRVPFPVVALVGYTNAGKSTLFNALTGSAVVARDQLFATLDPTMRGLRLPSGRRVILSDTVGFISELPHELVEAFRATLEEVSEADVILHVRDAAHPDSAAQQADVLAVLEEMERDGTLDPALAHPRHRGEEHGRPDGRSRRGSGAARRGRGLRDHRRGPWRSDRGDRPAYRRRHGNRRLRDRTVGRRAARLAVPAWRGDGSP